MTQSKLTFLHVVSDKLVTTKLTEPAEQQGTKMHSGQALNLAVANSIKNITFKTS